MSLVYSMVLKVVLLSLRKFEPLCKGQVVLADIDITTVVAYINKGGYDISLCPSLETLVLVQALVIREQGISDQVAERIEPPQGCSTKALDKGKWTVLFTGVNQVK